MSIWKFATISLSPKSMLIPEGSKMNVKLCVISWLPRTKNKHNNIMGNHFILQNSNTRPPKGQLIRNGIHYDTNARSNHIDLPQSLCERMP